MQVYSQTNRVFFSLGDVWTSYTHRFVSILYHIIHHRYIKLLRQTKKKNASGARLEAVHSLVQAFWLLTELIHLSWLISLDKYLWKLIENVEEKNRLYRRWIDKAPTVSPASYYTTTAWRFTFFFLYLHFNLQFHSQWYIIIKQTPLILIHLSVRSVHHLKRNFSFSELNVIYGYIVLFSISAIFIWLWHDTVSKGQIIAFAMIMEQYFALFVLLLVVSWVFLVEEKSECQGPIK